MLVLFCSKNCNYDLFCFCSVFFLKIGAFGDVWCLSWCDESLVRKKHETHVHRARR